MNYGSIYGAAVLQAGTRMQVVEIHGAVERNRTSDLLITNQCDRVAKSRLEARLFYGILPVVAYMNQLDARLNYGKDATCHCGQNPGGLCGECWLSDRVSK